MEDGELTATVQKHRKREAKFIKEEELLQFVQKFDQANTLYIEWIESLTPYLIEGKLVKCVCNSVYLDSSNVTKPVMMSSMEYTAINKILKETNSTIEEFLVVP